MAQQRRYDPLDQHSEVTLVPNPGTQTVSPDRRSLLQEGHFEQLSLGPLHTQEGGFAQGSDKGPTVSTERCSTSTFARKPTSVLSLWELFLDLLLAVPAILFLVYAGFVSVYDGKPIDTEPVPKLRTMAGYGPTIFPIAFAAIAANLLKTFAAWKLERGISVLSLQFLLRSRTVFSAFTTPLTVGTISSMTPLILILWALSPLGGQAALRVVGEAPSSSQEPWNYRYLDFRSYMLQVAPRSSAGAEVLPAILGAFTTALGSPEDIKSASQDAFGNIKIPMLEPFLASNRARINGWYDLEGETNITYSSIAGLPIEVSDGLGLRGNHSFKMETSYMYNNCTVSHYTPKNETFWPNYLKKHQVYNNGRTIVLEYVYRNYLDSNTKPLEVVFTSWSSPVIANTTCSLTTTYLEVDMKCHQSDCSAKRIRPLVRPDNVTALTVLDGLGPTGKLEFSMQMMGFMETFVNATDTSWSSDWAMHQYSTPIEYYFTNPGSPYSDVRNAAITGAKVWAVSDKIFSQRFSQLFNTFWIANIAPFAATGSVEFLDAGINYTSMTANDSGKAFAQDGVGTFTPDILVLRANRAWLGVLVVASATMLIAAVAAACLGSLRRGPDILDYTTSFMRDNPYVNVTSTTQSSMEDGSNQMRRLKNVRICLGDVTPAQAKGYVALATVGEAVPLGKQGRTRTYE
ncbi:hypothetical protein G7Z17_g12494 [Cylindrodendrum hubeiense]|uniref:Uncharacterized protein n=1 Tax=Cylindrodendrum hubeiense TaxID=595255 RepID=A0A9P5GVE5_9HYPO|nr:hypothetical protein G7Z17_g12494 [Cylindrodendrum hubeiense]